MPPPARHATPQLPPSLSPPSPAPHVHQSLSPPLSPQPAPLFCPTDADTFEFEAPDDKTDIIDIAAAAVGAPRFGVLECLKASTALFLARAAMEINAAQNRNHKHRWKNDPALPLTFAFRQLCDCLELLRLGLMRADPLLLIDDERRFITACAVDIFKGSGIEARSGFSRATFKEKVKDWFVGSTRYGNGSAATNINAIPSAMRFRALTESMEENGPQPSPSRPSRLSATALAAHPAARSDDDDDDDHEQLANAPPAPAPLPSPTTSRQSVLNPAPFSPGFDRLFDRGEQQPPAAQRADDQGPEASSIPLRPSLPSTQNLNHDDPLVAAAAPQEDPARPSLTHGLSLDVLGTTSDNSPVEAAIGGMLIGAAMVGNVADGTLRLANRTAKMASGTARFAASAVQHLRPAAADAAGAEEEDA